VVTLIARLRSRAGQAGHRDIRLVGLLVVLDGWAAWSVSLFGSHLRPHGTPRAVVVALGYRGVSRLVGPGFAALIAVQPVLPLLVVDSGPGVGGWSLTFTALALVNLGVAARHRSAPGGYELAIRVSGWPTTALGSRPAPLISPSPVEVIAANAGRGFALARRPR
jgi:hypothetical protein